MLKMPVLAVLVTHCVNGNEHFALFCKEELQGKKEDSKQ
jgi:hypothetical protein